MAESCDNDIHFEMIRGDDNCFRVDITDEDCNTYDIRGKAFKMTLKKSTRMADSKAGLQIDVDELQENDSNAALGTVYLPYTGEQTKRLTPGIYHYDIQMEESDVVSTVVIGRVRVLADVTRRVG